LAGLACSSYTLAASAKVDLQVRNAYINKFTDGNSQYFVEFLYVVIQNNGPDDFNGTFSISASNGSRYGKEKFTGRINHGQSAVISVIGSPTLDPYSIYVDCNGDVLETNEGNNYLYFVRDEPQLGIVGGWSGNDARYYNDTLLVLPGEYIYSQFSLTEYNQVKSIIGINYSIDSYDFTGNSTIDFGIQHYSENNFNNGTYSFRDKEYYYNYYSDNFLRTTFNWMANSNESALNYWWLGDFSGENTPSVVGEIKDIYISVNVALMCPGTVNTTNKYLSLTRSIKTIDRIRGDVNDDGVVDQADVDILVDVVTNNLYNPCQPTPNIYQEKGLNYGAGIVLFSRPDFVSNCLLNIWVHDKTDPLVQGLGIGEMMSETVPGSQNSSVQKVANSFEVSGENLKINAPGADLYNVTAQTLEGKTFQATGKMGESVQVPLDAKSIRVETVKIKQNLTAVASIKNNINVSVYPNPITDYVNIKSADKGIVKVVTLNGQTIFSAELKSEEELRISASSWANGIYFINVSSATGKKTVKIIK